MLEQQHTISKSVSIAGIGLHTGNPSHLTFHPAPPNTGIFFRRSDLPGSPQVKADIENVIDISRGTTIAKGEAVVHTVEHVLAAIAGLPSLRASGATPTPDRLAAPPTVASPNQADDGAQLYWQHCQPCHGDRGQGLTDEWRAQYPPEDQNCWKSRCHGQSPYEHGFILPTQVPALVAASPITETNHTQSATPVRTRVPIPSTP